MSRKSKSDAASKRDAGAVSSFYDNMMQMQMAALSSLSWLGAEWAGAVGQMSGEFLQFMADRIKEDVRFQHSCLQCKTSQDLQKLQAEFVQKAIDQYVAETGKLVEIGSSVLNQSRDA